MTEHESLNNSKAKEFVRRTKAKAMDSLHRGKRSIFASIAKLLFHRAAFVSVAILLQIALLAVLCIWFLRWFALYYLVYIIISVAAVLTIIGSRYQSAYKIAWAVLVLALPLFGGVMYLLYGGNRLNRRERKALLRQEAVERTCMGHASSETTEVLSQMGGDVLSQSRYIEHVSFSPPHLHTEAEYFSLGDRMFQRMKEELEKAERFIFLEYFIIREGAMWGDILEILLRKAEQGVDVRVMYDDIGCLYSLPRHYDRKLRAMGIKCEVFNRYRPVVSLRLNNRDHRKIMVIDGNVGFTGGINLSDEYINRWNRFGHWKDTGIMLRGEAVWNFTVMFLSTWRIATGEREHYADFRPTLAAADINAVGVVQPYDDSPLDSRTVGAAVYHNMIAKASRYLYITTPYLIIDDDMTSALCIAAQSGVDVRIITPHIPDKKIVFELTRAHYQILLESGVRIFEYTPGFIHAKTFACDDRFGTVGTVNLDYRSLYLHFECGVWLTDCSTVMNIRDDFLATQAVSREVTLADAKRFSRTRRLMHALLRAFAPLF